VRATRSATRQAVHSDVSYPRTSGPRFNASRIRSPLHPARRGRPTGPSRALQACLARLRQSPRPPIDRLAMDAEAARDFPFRHPARQQTGAATQAPRLDPLKSRRTPAGFPMRTTLSHHSRNVTILCDAALNSSR
jgi:hypothetical protein